MRLVLVLLLAPLPLWADAARLHGLVVERLGYMEAVALWKWHAGTPVEDLEREAVVLERAVQDAMSVGLPAEEIERFYAAQIAAAKAIQFCWIDRFRTGAATPRSDPPNLVTEVRPALLELGTSIAEEIAASADDPDVGNLEDFRTAAQGLECLDGWHLSQLAESLARITDD